MTDVYADSTAAKASFAHSEGGKEYYWKMLKRNRFTTCNFLMVFFRILRDLHPHLYTKVTASGDIRGIPTSIIMRYDHLKDVKEEDDELQQVVGGDDF